MKFIYCLTILLIISGCSNIAPKNNYEPLEKESALLAKLESSPNDIYTIGSLGDLHKNAFFETNNPTHAEKAIAYYEKVQELSPNHLGVKLLTYELHYLLYLNHRKSSKASLEKAFENIPLDNRVYLTPPPLAELLRALATIPNRITEKKYKELTLKAVKQSPKNATSYIFLSSYHTGKGQYSTARALLKRGLSHQPEDAFLLASLGDTYIDQAYQQECAYDLTSHWENAEKYYSQVKKLNPKDASSRASLSEIYLALNKVPLSLYEAKAAYKIKKDEDTFSILLDAIVPSDQPEEMLALIEAAEPNLAQMVTTRWYAEDMMQFGRWDESLFYFKKLMENKTNAYDVYSFIQSDLVSRKTESDWRPNSKAKLSIETDWQKQLIAFWRGQLSKDQLLEKASDRCKKTEAHTYIGFLLIEEGNHSQAAYHLEKAMEQGIPRFVEHSLAKHLLEDIQ